MTEQLTRHDRRHRVSAARLSVIEILVLAPLAALLAFWLIPMAFDIEWSCVGGSGMTTGAGESFAETIAVVGSLGWFFTLLGMLFATIADRDRLAALLPVAWFAILTVAMTAAAASVGPAPCPT